MGVFPLCPAPRLLAPALLQSYQVPLYWGFPRAGDRLKGLNYVCEQEELLTLLPQDKTVKVPKLPQTPSAILVVGYFWDHPQVSSSKSALAAGLLYLHHHQPHTARW